ncbi:Uncharacterised protein [Mycobacteroides abscessus subsp. abscessus]|nr:Uncharacterised protein [Mycobacteroides abscessus subsp. abscessus]
MLPGLTSFYGIFLLPALIPPVNVPALIDENRSDPCFKITVLLQCIDMVMNLKNRIMEYILHIMMIL